eukprot:4003125-Prymnesium_polylepis.1
MDDAPVPCEWVARARPRCAFGSGVRPRAELRGGAEPGARADGRGRWEDCDGRRRACTRTPSPLDRERHAE